MRVLQLSECASFRFLSYSLLSLVFIIHSILQSMDHSVTFRIDSAHKASPQLVVGGKSPRQFQ